MAVAAALTLLVRLAPALAEPRPTWSERQTMERMRGQLRLDPGALAIGRERRPPVGGEVVIDSVWRRPEPPLSAVALALSLGAWL